MSHTEEGFQHKPLQLCFSLNPHLPLLVTGARDRGAVTLVHLPIGSHHPATSGALYPELFLTLKFSIPTSPLHAARVCWPHTRTNNLSFCIFIHLNCHPVPCFVFRLFGKHIFCQMLLRVLIPEILTFSPLPSPHTVFINNYCFPCGALQESCLRRAYPPVLSGSSQVPLPL